jgi:hypothetical protein
MDFNDISFESLKNIIDKGYISIDWWEGDVFGNNRGCTYYLRVRNKDADIVDASWGGECILLTNNGCSLSFNERPKGGRGLIPKEDFNCEVTYSKKDSCRDWYPYQDILTKLVDIYY